MKKLTVLEYPYSYGAWHLSPEDHSHAFSRRTFFTSGRRATEDFRLCGVYSKAGIPWEIHTVTGLEYPDLPPHEAIPLSYARFCQDAAAIGNGILLSSGYCAFAPAVAGGLMRALGPDIRLGIIWIDAHADNKIVETTKSRDLRFVGFPLSAIAGQTMRDWSRQFCLLDQPVDGCRILVSDARCSGQEAMDNLKQAGITMIPSDGFEDPELWKEQVDRLAGRCDAIYLAVDMDILTSESVPAYFRREPGGHTVKKTARNIRTVMNTGKVAAFSCFCIDFDKYEEGGDVTYLNAMRLIGAGLEAWGAGGNGKRETLPPFR